MVAYPKHVRMIVGLLLAAGAAMRLWLIFGLEFLEEDSLITLRYAKNLWEGHGLVYNPGQRVMGFTSPLWTLLTSPIIGLFQPGSARLVLTLLCLVLYSSAVAVFLKLAPSGFKLGSWGLLVFAGSLALEPRLVAESVSGMEMSLFLLLISAAFWAAETKRLYLAFGLASASFLTRPEGAIVWALLFIYVAASPDRKFRKLPLIESAVPSAAIVLPWLAFATLYYGSPIPRSAASKSMWGSEGFSLLELSFRPGDLDLLWRNMTGLYVLKLPSWARGSLSVGAALVWAFAVLSAAKKRQRLILLAQGLLASLLAFYYLGRGLFFPWYAVTTITLFALAVASLSDRIAESVGRLSSRLSGDRTRTLLSTACAVSGSLLLAASFVVMTLRVLPWQDARRYEETVLKPTAEYLRDCTPPDARVMLEPLGYIGFYSERTVMDLAGLVSPEFRPTPEKFQPGWGAAQILTYRPHYLILRVYEVSENKFFASFDAPMFADEHQREEFESTYVEARRFESSSWPERSLVVYRRLDAPVMC